MLTKHYLEDETFLKNLQSNYKYESSNCVRNIQNKLGELYEEGIKDMIQEELMINSSDVFRGVKFQINQINAFFRNGKTYSDLLSDFKLKDFLCELNVIKESEKIYYAQTCESQSDRSESDNCKNSSGSKNIKFEINIPSDNNNPTGKFLFDKIRNSITDKKNEIEIDTYFCNVNGEKWRNFRNKYFYSDLNSEINICENYEIFAELCLDITTHSDNKLKQLCKLSCFLLKLKEKFPKKNLFIQFISNSDIEKFKQFNNKYKESLHKILNDLRPYGILFSFDYLSLSFWNSVIYKEINIQKETNLTLKNKMEILMKDHQEQKDINENLMKDHENLMKDHEEQKDINKNLSEKLEELSKKMDNFLCQK